MRVKKVLIPIYFGTLIMVQDNDFTKASYRFGVELDNLFEAVVFHKITKDGFTEYYVVFKENPSLQVIVHEIVHIVNRIYSDRNIRLDPLNDEPQAYLSGWVMKQIQGFLNLKHD